MVGWWEGVHNLSEGDNRLVMLCCVVLCCGVLCWEDMMFVRSISLTHPPTHLLLRNSRKI